MCWGAKTAKINPVWTNQYKIKNCITYPNISFLDRLDGEIWRFLLFWPWKKAIHTHSPFKWSYEVETSNENLRGGRGCTRYRLRELQLRHSFHHLLVLLQPCSITAEEKLPTAHIFFKTSGQFVYLLHCRKIRLKKQLIAVFFFQITIIFMHVSPSSESK